MEPRQQYEVLIRLLEALVAERGGDPRSVGKEYPWPLSEPAPPTPQAVATSMSSLLTGSLDGVSR